MSFTTKERVLKLILPAAGYVLALGALAVLAAPAISKIQKLWNADKLPVVEEEAPARPSSRTLVARSSDWSSATPSILSETSNSGISLPRRVEEEESEQDFAVGDSALAQQGYMPILGGQSRNTGNRQLTRAERKRLQEKREREETWAYGTTEEIMEMTEKEALNSNDDLSGNEDNFEEEAMESIILKDRKTLLLYRAMKAGGSDFTAADDPTRRADSRTDSASSGQSDDSQSASESPSDEKAYADSGNDPLAYREKSPFSSEGSVLSFADKPLYMNHNLLSSDNPLFANSDQRGGLGSSPIMQQRQTSSGDDFLGSAKSSEQRISDFRAMISAPTAGRSPIGTPPDNRAVISSSGSGIPGLNPNPANVGTPGRITLPGGTQPDSALSGPLSAPAPARSLMPESPTRGTVQENPSSRAIPRLIIRR